jgi:hypothetical protein
VLLKSLVSSCKKKNYFIQQFIKGSPPPQEIEKFFLVALSGLGFIEEFFFTTQKFVKFES